MLEIRALTVAYDEVVALRSLSLKVMPDEIVTLIGGNGAGKSSTLRAVSNLLKLRSGQILFDGQQIGGLSPDRIVSMGIAHVPEGRRVFPQLSVEDNLKVGAYLRHDVGGMRDGIEGVYLTFPRLKERRRQQAETLSGGEQQMLALGRALMSRPRMLLLDEPFLGLAPLIVEDVARAILSFRKQGITILLVEQNARIALAIADRGYVIQNGRIILEDSAKNLRVNPKIIESYLGGRTSADMEQASVHVH